MNKAANHSPREQHIGFLPLPNAIFLPTYYLPISGDKFPGSVWKIRRCIPASPPECHKYANVFPADTRPRHKYSFSETLCLWKIVFEVRIKRMRPAIFLRRTVNQSRTPFFSPGSSARSLSTSLLSHACLFFRRRFLGLVIRTRGLFAVLFGP